MGKKTPKSTDEGSASSPNPSPVMDDQEDVAAKVPESREKRRRGTEQLGLTVATEIAPPTDIRGAMQGSGGDTATRTPSAMDKIIPKRKRNWAEDPSSESGSSSYGGRRL